MANVDILDFNGLQTKDFNTLLDDIQTNIQNIYAPNGEQINFDSSSPDGQITNVLAEIGTVCRELLTEIYNSMSPSTCSGAVQDVRYQINYLWRKGGTFTIQNIAITTDRTVTLQGLDANYYNVNASSYTVSDDAGNLWFLIDTTTLTAGTTSLPFRAKELGQVVPTIGTITQQNTIVTGVTNVINSVGYTSLGEEQETDEEFRIRRERSVANASVNNVDTIIGELLQLDGVTDVYCWLNNTNSTDATSTPAHTLWTIVNGGANSEIAQILYENIGGSDTRGSVTVNTPTIAGQTLVMRFDRPTIVPVYVKFNIKVTGDKDNINVDGLKAQLVESSAYNIGQDISSAELTSNATYALNTNGGANIAYITDLEISLDNSTWTNLIQTSTKADLFTLDTSRITATIVEV